jgi:hypothetical protein
MSYRTPQEYADDYTPETPDEFDWIVEIWDEDAECVEVIPVAASDREQAMELAWPRTRELRAEHENDNLMPARVYRDAR